MLLNIFVAALIAGFVALIITAYFYEHRIAKVESRYADKRIVTQSDYNLSMKLAEDAGYKKGYIDGGLDAKKQFARMFRDYPTKS